MELKINNDKYVCYNEFGMIEKISKRPDEKLDSLKLPYNNVKDLLEGKESLVNYRVEYDFLEKKYILKSTQQWQSDQLITAFIYEIPNCTDDDYEIRVIQNNVERCWTLEINPNFIKKLQDQNIKFNPVEQQFSVTKRYDPNILYRTLRFNTNTSIPFENDFEFDNEEVSVYTIRKFSTYIHEVINEQ